MADRARLLILLALAGVTAVVSFYPTSEATVAPPLHRRPQPSAPRTPAGSSEVDAAAPIDEQADDADPFAPRSWLAPPPIQEAPKAATVAAPAPAPVAPPGPPPLPYKFMGRMNDDNESSGQVIYLSKGDQMVTVQGGETLDDTYKVLSVAADHIDFEHLPTGEKQSLPIAPNDK